MFRGKLPGKSEPCPYCGAPGVGGFDGCRRTLEKISARFMNRPGFLYFYPTQKALVDCYALQHPEIYCTTPESYLAHLVGLAIFLEYGGKQEAYDTIAGWMHQALDLPTLEAPRERGAIKISDLADVKTPPDLQARVKKWAEQIWSAYSADHLAALSVIRSALGEREEEFRNQF